MNATCGHPVGADDHPCRKPAISAYVVGGKRYYKCRVHDAKVRPAAEEKGVAREQVAA